MTDKEMIEEMKRTLEMAMCEELPFIDTCEMGAKALFEKGYRKIPENAVVLTREEFDNLGLVLETVQEYESDEKGQPILVKERKTVKKLRTDFTELLNQEIRELQIEKRARIEILETLLDLEDSKGVITLTTRELIEIAKSYGIIVGND